MDFRPLNDTERRQLINSLRGNAEGGNVLLMDRRDTSFAGTSEDNDWGTVTGQTKIDIASPLHAIAVDAGGPASST